MAENMFTKPSLEISTKTTESQQSQNEDENDEENEHSNKHFRSYSNYSQSSISTQLLQAPEDVQDVGDLIHELGWELTLERPNSKPEMANRYSVVPRDIDPTELTDPFQPIANRNPNSTQPRHIHYNTQNSQQIAQIAQIAQISSNTTTPRFYTDTPILFNHSIKLGYCDPETLTATTDSYTNNKSLNDYHYHNYYYPHEFNKKHCRSDRSSNSSSTISSNRSKKKDYKNSNGSRSSVNSSRSGRSSRSSRRSSMSSVTTTATTVTDLDMEFENKSRSTEFDLGDDLESEFDIDGLNNLTNESVSIDNSSLIAALGRIAHKFDAMFPFYRLSDKDCKKLSLFVLDEIMFINKIFCDCKGRDIHVKVYYYVPNVVKDIYFYNDQDSEKEVSQWKDINMNKEYCANELGIKSTQQKRYRFSI